MNATNWPANAQYDARVIQTCREDLAAAFRWTARLDMHEGVANHYSLAVSDDGKQFLINPNGVHFSRITASGLLQLDADDPGAMERPDAPDPTAWAIHGAIHRRVPDARCIMHLHSKYATVLASLKDSTLYPVDQNSMRFFEQVSIDDGFDGMGLGEEAERLALLVAARPIVMMGNHGVLVTGRTVAEAFDLIYYFERACETLISAYMTGRELRIAPDAVARKTAQQWVEYPDFADNHIREIRAVLDAQDPEYRA